MSQAKSASIFSRGKRSTEISGKTKLSLIVPKTKGKSLSKEKERRKSVLSIAERKTNSLQHESFKWDLTIAFSNSRNWENLSTENGYHGG